MSNAVAGDVIVRVNGEVMRISGDVTYNTGTVKREAIVGGTGVLGFKEMNQVPFVEFKVIDGRDFDLTKLVEVTDATVIVELKSGKTIILTNAWFAGEAQGSSESGEISGRFEALKAKVD
ncbi:MAG: phage tail tube protein [Planctomycetota bacterium]